MGGRTNYNEEYAGLFRKGVLLFLGILLVIVVIGGLIGFLMAPGCAAGRVEGTGDVVVGFRVAELPEQAGEFLSKAADFLPPPFNYLAGGAVTLLVGGGGAALARRRAEQAPGQAAHLAARGVI